MNILSHVVYISSIALDVLTLVNWHQLCSIFLPFTAQNCSTIVNWWPGAWWYCCFCCRKVTPAHYTIFLWSITIIRGATVEQSKYKVWWKVNLLVLGSAMPKVHFSLSTDSRWIVQWCIDTAKAGEQFSNRSFIKCQNGAILFFTVYN